MADPDPATATQEPATPSECMPCRGTGRVTSFLGGDASEVTCPWCGGSGERTAGIDAQARWLGDGEGDRARSSDPDAAGEPVDAA